MITELSPQVLQDQDLHKCHKAIGTVSSCLRAAKGRGAKVDPNYIENLKCLLLDQVERLDEL